MSIFKAKTRHSLKNRLLLIWFGTLLALLLILGGAQSYFVQSFHSDALQKGFRNSFNIMVQTLEFYVQESSNSARQLASKSELINSVSLIHSYQNKEKYVPIIFDVEKENLATILTTLELINDINLVAVFDLDGDVTAFNHSPSYSDHHTGYTHFERGGPQLKVQLQGSSGGGDYLTSTDHYLRESLARLKPTTAPTKTQIRYTTHHNYISVIIATPIYRQEGGNGSPIGTLVVSRLLSESLLKQIAELTGSGFAYTIHSGKSWISSEAQAPLPALPLTPEEIPLFDRHQSESWRLESTEVATFALARWVFGPDLTPYFYFSRTNSSWLNQLESMKYAMAIALSSILLLLLPLTLWLLRRVILRPLDQMYQAVIAIQPGSYPHLPYFQREDEFGLFASALNRMSSGLQQRDHELLESMEQIRSSEQALRDKSVQLQELNESLEDRVKQRTRELMLTNAEMERTLERLKRTQNELIEAEKMASLGGLVAGIAHEINTPIGIGLTGMSHFDEELEQLALKFEQDELDEHDFQSFLHNARELSRTILASLNRAADQVRSFKRVAVDQSHSEIQNFKLKEYCNEVLLSLHNRLKQTRHQIVLVIDPELTLTSDPGSFSQIFTNLITNSLLHAFREDEVGTITLTATRQLEEKILLTYCDNGCGIPVEHRDKIFDPFFTTRRNNGGTGLGLNIVYNIVTKKLQGSVRVEYPSSGGVCFLLTLPLQIATPSPHPLIDS